MQWQQMLSINYTTLDIIRIKWKESARRKKKANFPFISLFGYILISEATYIYIALFRSCIIFQTNRINKMLIINWAPWIVSSDIIDD